MKKYVKLLIVSLFLLMFPFITFASKDKITKVEEITGVRYEENKLNIYFFHGAECPHCAEARAWLKDYLEHYNEQVVLHEFEVWHNEDNAKLLRKVLEEYEISSRSIPCTVINDQVFIGFSETVEGKMENEIDKYFNKNTSDGEYKLPLIGKVNVKNFSLPIIAIVLGIVDGFNPCAMWILLFLINMLLGTDNKKRKWILGLTFLFVSGAVYFFSMLGLTFVLSMTTVTAIKVIIGLVALVAGGLNLKNYIESLKKKDGCTVVDDKKRKKIFTKIRKFTTEKNFWLALIGIIALAISVNLIELACSLGFPMVFTEILAINNVQGIGRILYLLLYVLLYMADDIVIFVISMVTLEATGITNKYSKYSHLIGGILMILMGILLIFKPDWLMLNFG